MSAIARAGDQIAGRYDLIELLVETPAGWWFRALDREVEVELGLLAVRAELVPDPDRRDQLLGAAVEMRGVVHRHLIRLFDAGVDPHVLGGSAYLTAQLSRALAPPATPEDVIAYAAAVAGALDAVHRAGQVHGRLVPADIVDVSGQIKVMGAGLHDIVPATVAMPWWGPETRFWAPEVARGQRATPAADVYSLAAIVAELLAGQPGDVDQAMAVLATRARAFHDALEPALSPALDHRPASPTLLSSRVAAALGDDDIDSAPTRYFVKKPETGSGASDQAVRPSPGSDQPSPGSDQPSPELDDEPTESTPPPAPPVLPRSARASTVKPLSGAPAAGKQAMQFVSMKPPSEQGARRTPVIPAIDKPEMKPKIRALTSPRAITAPPGGLGRYAPPRDDSRGKRRAPTWVYMAAAAVISAALAVALTLAIYGGEGGEGGSGTERDGAGVAAVAAAIDAAIDAPPARPTCAADMILIEHDERSYCIEVYESPGQGHTPQVDLTLAAAEAACRARGRRLCTKHEWAQACRGPGGARWPYGDAFDPRACNASPRRGALEPAGSRRRCVSPLGVHDMSGNAAEWVAGGEIRGGSARDRSDARCSRSEQRKGPERGYPDVGFRCCADPERR